MNCIKGKSAEYSIKNGMSILLGILLIDSWVGMEHLIYFLSK
jgi:hypothetical protein